MTNPADNDRDDTPEVPRGDRLDALLRAWHDENADSARAKRDEILRAVAAQESRRRTRPAYIEIVSRIGFARMAAAAMLAVAAALFLSLLVGPTGTREAFAEDGVALVAEGGALEAVDADGNPLGACPLRHTDVSVEITGLFARTVVEQTYTNPFPRTIEAVYTFPLSNRAAVDRMTMVVRGASGERIVEGEVKERSVARAIYEDARESGFVASLLEQERPNIFTQSVANIEPGATVKMRIATIELVERKDGVAQYAFPMVVGPRYVPGKSTLAATAMPKLPDGWTVREGLVLRGPARVESDAGAAIAGARLERMLAEAIPVRASGSDAIDAAFAGEDGVRFLARYADGGGERGVYAPSSSIGEINGRFFFVPPVARGGTGGTGFASPTDEVRDADRITPMPVRPQTRAGHDISVTVSIETGAAPIGSVTSEQHEVRVDASSPTRRVVTLADRKTIPNRDFIVRWESRATGVEPAFFAHTAETGEPDARGGFVALMLEPPARIAPETVRPRELVFVLDVSGSMNGFPLEKSKELARKAIARMRPGDTFNIVTFAGATAVLWPEPRAATEENIALADRFIDGLAGNGGTEMMDAINSALVQPGRSALEPARLLGLPADGRVATVAVPAGTMSFGGARWSIAAGTASDGSAREVLADIPIVLPENPQRRTVLLEGAWTTTDGERVFMVRSARFEDIDARTRIVFFLTDGYIGNDQAVVQAVRDNARASRVFSFGIGTSVNRFLLDEMARAGRGVCEVVTLAADADAVVDRLVRRIEAPVLTDLELVVDPALGIRELMPAGERLPDLYDVEPLVLLGRFDRAARGSITLRGRTGAGAWERTIAVDLPEREARHEAVAALWARSKVDALIGPKMAALENGSLDAATRSAVVRLGEAFRVATPFTSFVAVEKSRVVVGGKPLLVSVPVELPSGTNWNTLFGDEVGIDKVIRAEVRSAVGAEDGAVARFGRDLARSFSEGGGAAANEQGDAKVDASARESVPTTAAAPPAPAASSAALPSIASPTPPSAAPPRRELGKTLRTVESAKAKRAADPSIAASPAPVAASAMPRLATGSSKPGAHRRPGTSRDMDAAPMAGEPGGGGGSGGGGGFGSAERAASDTGAATADAQVALLPRSERDTLARVLERRLLILALAARLGSDTEIPAMARELALPLEQGSLLVAVRTEPGAAEPNGALRAAIAGVGGTIVAEDGGRSLLVVRVAPKALAQMAVIPGVLRVEPLVGSEPERP